MTSYDLENVKNDSKIVKEWAKKVKARIANSVHAGEIKPKTDTIKVKDFISNEMYKLYANNYNYTWAQYHHMASNVLGWYSNKEF